MLQIQAELLFVASSDYVTHETRLGFLTFVTPDWVRGRDGKAARS